MRYDTGCFHDASRVRMTDEFDKLFEKIKRESLSGHERSVSREGLKLFMAEHPARAPFVPHIAATVRETLATFRLPSLMRLHPVALSLMFVFCVGVGTSYAAEEALPGDTLYPVKINVNEQVQGALALSPQAKAGWNAKRATRRLEEAEALASEGRLTAALQTDLETRFEKTADDFDANVLSLASATGSPSVVAAATSNLEASLQERADALAQIATFASTSKDEITALRKRIDERTKRVQRVRVVADRFAGLQDGQDKNSLEIWRDVNAAPLRAVSVQASSFDAGSTTEATQPPSALQTDTVLTAPPAKASPEETALGFQAAIQKAQSDDSGDEKKGESER